MLVSAKRLTQIVWFYGVHHNLNLDDPKTEKPGLISRLWGWLFGHNTQGLKESSEPSLDRLIRQNDRNLTAIAIAIAGLLTYLGNADLSNFSLEFLINFNLCGPDFNTTIKSYSDLIRTSWSSITVLVAILFASVLFVIAVIIFIRGECLNHQAKRVEASHDNDKTIKAHQEVEQAQAEAAQYRERAESAESEVDKLRGRLTLVEAEAAQNLDRAIKAEAESAQNLDRAIKAEAESAQNLDRAIKAEAESAQNLNRATKAEADNAQLRKELENLQSEASKASVELTKAETELAKVKAGGAMLVYEALANNLNKKGN